jgi:hypothetical protein
VLMQDLPQLLAESQLVQPYTVLSISVVQAHLAQHKANARVLAFRRSLMVAH